MHESDKPIPLLVTRDQAMEILWACKLLSDQYKIAGAITAAQDTAMLALQIKTQMEEGV